MAFTEQEIHKLNQQFKGIPPEEIISWAIQYAENPLVTTNFRPYEVAILHSVTDVAPKIPVVWCDTGYNTPNTYKHAEELIARLHLNVKL